jgi:sulfatase maturation enzyme AslB (radical SAM superfamily)
VLQLVDDHKPLHLSIVGGDPLVRYRELEVLLPKLVGRGIHVQLVTSAFRPITASWATLPRLQISVSVDGLQPDHDIRRAPATYDRILKNIDGQRVTIHCTITSAMTKRASYIQEFLEFWSANTSVRKSGSASSLRSAALTTSNASPQTSAATSSNNCCSFVLTTPSST